jgi:hypothetical protein
VKGNPQTPILFDTYRNLLLEFDKIEEDINEAKYAYEAAYADYMMTKEFMEEESEEAKEKNGEVIEKKKNVIEKIGSGIKAIFQKAYQFICNIVDKLKGNKFKLENDLSKLSEFKKKHPDLANRIQISFEKGELNLKDAKSIADLERDYLAIMKMEDESKMGDAWLKAKQKFNDSADVLKTVGAAATAVLAIATLGPKVSQAFNSAAQAKHAMAEDKIKGYAEARAKGDITDNDGVNMTRLKISREYSHINMETASAARKLIMRIQDGIAGTMDKAIDSDDFQGSYRQAYHKRMQTDADTINARDDDNN